MEPSYSDRHFRVVDAHTHVFPPEVCEDKVRYCELDRWFGDLYSSPKAALVTADNLIESMDGAGIERSVMCGWPWKDEGLARNHNDYMADSASRFPDRLWWLATVPPVGGTALDALLSDAHLNGASGVGELNADAQGFDFSDSMFLSGLAEFSVAADWPVMFHVSEPVGHLYPGKGTATPARFFSFVEAHAELKIIAAHWGGGLPFYELMPEIKAACQNVWYDSAASTYLYDFRVFQSVLDIVGPDRVLFGSDFPVLKQDRFVKRVAGLAWKDGATRDQVMSQNASRLFETHSGPGGN